jgi:flagellin
MTDITLASGSALTSLDPRASQAATLAELARSVRSGQGISVSAGGFSVLSDRIGIAASAPFAARVQADSAAAASATHAVSLLATASAALAGIADRLDILAGLAEDAVDSSLSSQERARLDTQFQTVKSEIDDLAANTQFDGIKLLAGDGGDGALRIDYEVGTGSGGANRIEIRIGDASTTGLSASLASADLMTAASAGSAADAVDEADEALGSIQGTVTGDIARAGSAYLALQDQAAVNENARRSLVDPTVAADLARRTAEQVKAQSRLPLANNLDRQLVRLLDRLDAPAPVPSSRPAPAEAKEDGTTRPLTPEPAAATNQNSG